MWFVGVDSRDRRWLALNARLLGVIGVALIAAGLAGFVLPPDLALMSGAPAYNVFHLAAGVGALGLVFTHRPGLMASFNLGFGLIDLWQLIAGLAGLFPAELFALRPADHVVHALLGLLLVLVGSRGVAAMIRLPRTPEQTADGEGQGG
ncbi:MAG TPA: hypothetical protein VGF45_22105 [Polyangia bacterium]